MAKKYGKAKRAAAAKKGWRKRKNKYGKSGKKKGGKRKGHGKKKKSKGGKKKKKGGKKKGHGKKKKSKGKGKKKSKKRKPSSGHKLSPSVAAYMASAQKRGQYPVSSALKGAEERAKREAEAAAHRADYLARLRGKLTERHRTGGFAAIDRLAR